MKKITTGFVLALVVALGCALRAEALPSNPCSIVPKAQVVSIIGPTSGVTPRVGNDSRGLPAMQCTYAGGQRGAIIELMTFPSASAAQADLARVLRKRNFASNFSASVKGNILINTQVVDQTGPRGATPNQGLARKLLAAVMARL